MEEKMYWLPASIGMLALYTIFLGIAIGAYPGWDVAWPYITKIIQINWNFDANAVAWVQAFVAGATIIFTVAMTRWQLAVHREERLENERHNKVQMSEVCIQMCNAVLSIVGSKEVASNRRQSPLRGIFEAIYKVNEEPDTFKSLERIDDLQQVLRSLLWKDMPPELLSSLFSIQKHLVLYKEFIIHYKHDNEEGSRRSIFFVVRKIARQHKETKSEIDKIKIKIQSYKSSVENEMHQRSWLNRIMGF